MLVLFQKYGEKYNFDPLMLAAQGYQESQLNQNAKSRGGAIGVMQVMHWLKHTLIWPEDGKFRIGYKPVVITKYQPKERVY